MSVSVNILRHRDVKYKYAALIVDDANSRVGKSNGERRRDPTECSD